MMISSTRNSLLILRTLSLSGQSGKTAPQMKKSMILDVANIVRTAISLMAIKRADLRTVTTARTSFQDFRLLCRLLYPEFHFFEVLSIE